MFAEVSLPISSFQTFTYSIPENLVNTLSLGSRVKVPFGAREVDGIIVSLIEKSSFSGNLKSIINIDCNIPLLSNELWKLVNWISHYYVAPIGLAYNTVLPFMLLSNHSPRQAWFVKYLAEHKVDKKNTFKKLSVKQNLIFDSIRGSSPKYIKVSRFKAISSNPISICKSLEDKGLVILKKRDERNTSEENSFKSIKKNITYNK